MSRGRSRGRLACWCGRPRRGFVAATPDCPAHVCLQCSQGHCELTAYLAAHPEKAAEFREAHHA